MWTISGVLGPGEESLDMQINALKDHYSSGELTEVMIVDGSTTLEELVSDINITVSDCSFPVGTGPEWATKRKYVIVLEGVERPEAVNTLGEIDYAISYGVDQSTIVDRTIKGTVKDVVGDSYAKYLIAKNSNAWVTWAGANLIGDTYEVNDGDTLTSFSISHRQYWVGFGVGITNSSKSVEIDTDAMNVTRTRVSGWFEGSGVSCATAIAGIGVVSAVLLTSSISRDDYANRTSFTLDYISTTQGILYSKEEIALNGSVYDFVFKRVLGGAPPVKQYTGRTTATGTQAGEIRGLTTWPNVPAPHWSSAYIKSYTVKHGTPEFVVNSGSYIYPLH